MTQPRWMQGQPIEEENKPKWMQGEVISEVPPANPTPRQAVEAAPDFLTRTAGEKSADAAAANNRAFVDGLKSLDGAGGGGAFSGQYINSSSFGQGDTINAGIDTLLGIDTMGDDFSSRRQGHRGARKQLVQDNPWSALGGEITGYLAPGAVAWKGLANSARAIPGSATVNNLIQGSGRLPSFLSRIGGSSALFTADAALYGGTVGADNEALMRGEDASLGDRAKTASNYATQSVGETAQAFGLDTPEFLNKVPLAPALPAVGSIVERTVKGIGSGGKMVTPDRVQAEVLNNVGRAPSPNSTAGAMAEVIPGERVTGGTVKTFRFIENALRNGLKDAGLAPADITRRVARGFDSIRESLPTLADGQTTLAQIVEREFADAGPQVSENIRLFLLRVGLDDPAVTRGVIDEMRTGQVESFTKAIDDNFGPQRQYDLELDLKDGLKKLGEGYDQILTKAKEQGNNSPLAHSIRESLMDSRFKFELTQEASKRGWKDVDTFIQQDPWSAAHKLKSTLLSEARAAKSSGNYEKYQEPATYLREMLNELPGYQTLSKKFAEEAQVLDTLGHVKDLPNGQQVTTPGFGPALKKAARSETETRRIADNYAGMPARQQQAAGTSTAQVLRDQMRTARPGGTDLRGQDQLGLRLFDLQNEGVMSTNPKTPGALPTVFGEAGENISHTVDKIVDSRKFLADIDGNTGSNTVNKANALAAGDSVITSGLPRTMTQGFSKPALLDAALFASGMPPLATAMSKVPVIGRALSQPSKATRAEVARTLMQRPAHMGSTPTPPAPINPMSGRNRPRKWKNDPKWSDPNLTNPQIASDAVPPGSPVPAAAKAKPVENGIIPGGMAGEMGTGAVIGGNIPVDYDGDGEVTFKDRAIGAGIGAAGSQVPRVVGSASRAAPQASRTLPMDEASRMARAKEMGFDTEAAYYHGTDAAFDSFNPAAGSKENGVFLSRDPAVASRYAGTNNLTPSEAVTGKQVYPLHVRGKLKTVNWKGRRYDDDRMVKEIERARRQGFDGLDIKNIVDESSVRGERAAQTQTVMFDSKNIRSKFAKFDPAQSDSPIISNGFPGGKDAMRKLAQGQFPRTDAAQPPAPRPAPPPGGAVLPKVADDVPLHSNEYTLKEDMIKAGVVGTGVGVPSAAVLYNWYVADQYEKNKPAMSMQEFMQALEASQRQQNGLPPTPSLKPEALPQQAR